MYNVQINEIINKNSAQKKETVHKDSMKFSLNLSNIPIFTACSQMPSQIQ